MSGLCSSWKTNWLLRYLLPQPTTSETSHSHSYKVWTLCYICLKISVVFFLHYYYKQWHPFSTFFLVFHIKTIYILTFTCTHTHTHTHRFTHTLKTIWDLNWKRTLKCPYLDHTYSNDYYLYVVDWVCLPKIHMLKY